MEHYFEIGGCVVQVTAPDDLVDTSGTYLAPFGIAPASADFHMYVDLADELDVPDTVAVFDDPERRVYAHGDGFVSLIGSRNAPYMRMERRGNESHVWIKQRDEGKKIFGNELLKALEAEHLIVNSGGILLHSSFICHEDRAILFTAPSGTGKSTQAELWRSLRGAQVRNGDRSVVKKGSDGFEAWGVPFCGSSKISQPGHLPLEAIVVLSQAPQNTICRLSGVKAFRAIWEGCSFHTWNKADVSRCSQTVADLISHVPIYHLACTPDVRAVELLESVLYK